MKRDDLTRLKHIGPSRMKLLNDFGITTIEQLHKIPLKRLAGVTSIGEHYAKLIKDSVAAYYTGERGKLRGESLPVTEADTDEIDKRFEKKIAALNRRLNRANEDLKPLWKKKYLEQYIDFKKRAKQLKARLGATTDHAGKNLSKKTKKKIIKKADAIGLLLKKTGKKPKKKKYTEITRGIQSFSKMLREVLP
jgi:hypothetical protein